MTCPIWVEGGAAQLPALARAELNRGDWNTCIFLPLRKAYELRLNSRLEPATLLFLRKIRQLCVEELGIRRSLRMEEQSPTDDLMTDDLGGWLSSCVLRDTVTSLGGRGETIEKATDFCLYHRRSIRPPVAMGFGKDAMGDICIAIPVSAKLELQSFFTFLPVMSAGFPL